MDEKKLQDILIGNINELMSKEQNNTPSMKYLSTCIGANTNYMQKVLSGASFPSPDKLVAIANYFGVEPWMLLVEGNEEEREMISLLQMMKDCPKEMLPMIKEFVTYLLTHYLPKE